MADYTHLLSGSSSAPPDGGQSSARTNYADMLLGTTSAPKQQEKPKREVPWMESAAQGLIDTATFGYGDEIEAGLRAGAGKIKSAFGGQGETYDQALADVRERQENAPAASYYPGAIAGALIPGAGIAGAAGRATTRAGQYALGAGAGAVEGGLAASGEAEGGIENRLAAVPAGAALGAAGGAVGTSIGRGLTRFADRRAARDIERLNPNGVQEIQAQAQEHGVQLTPAEMTNLPSLAQQQKQVGNTVGAGDDLADFYRMRQDEQIEPAIRQYMDNISDFQGDEAAGELTRAAARRAMSNIEEMRADQASPIYQRAFADQSSEVDTDRILQSIARTSERFPETGTVRRRLERTARLLRREVIREGEDGEVYRELVPETSVDVLHGTKLELDQMLERSPSNPIGNTERRQITRIKNQLLEAMDAASPDYGAARAIYADLSPGVERVREGIAGTIADLPDQQLRTVAGRLFDAKKISPRSALEARRQLQGADPDAWQAIKRSYIEDAWIKASQETLGSGGTPVNAGAKFRKLLMGNARQRQILANTMEPEEFRALNSLTNVLEASGRVKMIGSDTEWNRLANEAAKKASASPLSRALRYVSLDALKEAANAWDERRFAANSDAVVRMITSPNGMELIRELRRSSPNAQFQRAVIGYALSQTAARSIDAQGGQPHEAQQPMPLPQAQIPTQAAAQAPIPGQQVMDDLLAQQRAATADFSRR